MENSENGKNATFEDELEVMRASILTQMLEEAVFEGWTVHGLEKSAISAGMSMEELKRGDLKLAFPNGIADILDYWSEQADEKMLTAYLEADPAPEKIREKVRFLVKARLEAIAEHKEAARRASATLALPIYASLAARLSWRTSDEIWRVLGDTSTDYNFYTKRATLNAVYLTTLSHWFAQTGEESDEWESTLAFLDDRIENIMQFEKTKAKVLKSIPDMNQFWGRLAKMRYGSEK